jgi:predicted dehydrogenase
VKSRSPIRIGILGAAAINYAAIFDAAQTHPDAIVHGIAARSKSKAEAQIAKYKLKGDIRTYGSYDEILADPDVDVIYIPLPNGLHYDWAIKALEAGKDVLIEKPIANNADETRRIQKLADEKGRVALEAWHWRFHPAAHKVRALIDSGDYGKVTGVSVDFLLPRGMFSKDDIRFHYDLGGGCSMDLAYAYCACLYFATGGNNLDQRSVRVLEATPRLHDVDKKIDEAMEARFIIECEGKGDVSCHTNADSALPPLFGFIPRIWKANPTVFIELEKARIEFPGFVQPVLSHSIVIKEKDGSGNLTGKSQTITAFVGDGVGEAWWSTYRHQLEAMVSMIKARRAGEEYAGPWVSMGESIKIMEIVDAVYEKAGLPRRGL